MLNSNNRVETSNLSNISKKVRHLGMQLTVILCLEEFSSFVTPSRDH